MKMDDLETKLTSMEEMESQHIRRVLESTRGIIEGENGAAKILNINPSTLRSRMKKLGISRPGGLHTG